MNEKFQRALSGEINATPPVWLMRQAGRYHSHYRKLREKHSFMDLCKVPELAAEVALGPIREFDFDVAILFSDLLFPLEALGLGLTYDPAPRLGKFLDEGNMDRLTPLHDAIAGLEFQRGALRATREILPKNKSLIGFVGGPWTLFTYAREGEHKGSLTKAKSSFALYRRFAAQILPLLIANIELQLEGGAEVVMIFDTAAGELAPAEFRQWLEPDLQQLAGLFPGQVGYYAKNVNLGHMRGVRGDSRWAGFGFDHRWEMAELLRAREFGFIQGNFDQALLHADQAERRAAFDRFARPLRDFSPEQRRGWVCGLGHGVLPGTPERAVHEFVEFVREVWR
jgi:uroporphyrinogen decarboxylase